MIKTPTVLILGAGASSHIGYPLGKSLINEICSWDYKQMSGWLPSKDGQKVFDQAEVETFLQRLSRGVFPSIDTFLERHRDFLALGKIAIARALKSKEHIDAMFPPKDSGWYASLFEALYSDDSNAFEQNRLSIITFNYDRSLEAFLYEALKARGLDEALAVKTLRKIPIIHVHGMLGSFPEIAYQPHIETTRELLAISEGIHIIHELQDCADHFCNSEFEKAHKLLKDAEIIAFMGFGFHSDNVRRFRFFSADALKGKKIYLAYPGPTEHEYAQKGVEMSEYGFNRNLFRNVGPTRFNCNHLVRAIPLFG